MTPSRGGGGQAWLAGPWFDGVFILAPPIVVSGLVVLLTPWITTHEVTPALWALLVVGIDVGHVYSTLWRTYFDPSEFQARRTLYVLAPVLGWVAFAMLYSLGPPAFWRALAYLAVFHFIRQQYGFMMLYGRRRTRVRWLDQAAIYAATLYPLVWWHTHARHFAWFVPGDFFALAWSGLSDAALVAYVAVLVGYAACELAASARRRRFDWPPNLLLAGTAVSWWVGIIGFDSDLAFTAVNVVAHGIPYVALVWLFGRRQAQAGRSGIVFGISQGRLFSAFCLPLFLLVPLVLAYVEEGFWDGLVWSEHPGLFRPFSMLPVVDDSVLLACLVPLLALPQITHYILDGFIWRRAALRSQFDPAFPKRERLPQS